MGFIGKLSELLRRPRGSRDGFPWTFYRLISPSLTAVEVALAAAIITNMMAGGGTISPEAAAAITALIENWDRFRLLPNPAETLAIVLLIHKGGEGLMSIIEKVFQPLLNAQREMGQTETNVAWREWLDRKTKAEAEGKPFNEPPPDEERK